MQPSQIAANVFGLLAALACAGGWLCATACGGKTVDDDIGATGSSGSGSGSGSSSGTGSGSNSSSGSGSGGGSSSGSSDGSSSGSGSGSGSGSSSGANLTDAGPDAQPADAGIADAPVDDASEAGTDAGAWIDMSSNPAACVNEPNVPCGWAPTNYGLGYTCGCREGTWEDGWTCDLPDAAVFPGPTCPADGGP